jgi:hypothetical protein
MPEFEHYQIAYAERRHIPAHWILEFERLELAAYLEHMVRTHVYSVTEARRKFVKNYPETNRPMVGRTIIDHNNEYVNDNEYEKTSVLWLIQPFDDSIWDIPKL